MERILNEIRLHHQKKEMILHKQMMEINDELRNIFKNMDPSQLQLWAKWQYRRNLKENILARVNITPS
jgi:hypothetical protein